ncbi:hypothetical protein [Streptomyces sp. TLI_171]|uniref:hypothetical protein n=1 Tax=Streptomyces sp. TLI_171 TaxID=1938859 RepID=UPI000C18A7D3|nr:hypothetical protein [Streptomyces sp. TLI_171]RKE22011.1 hypothetical protein BX266_5420 [Streptomyces sp. TLI_171]
MSDHHRPELTARLSETAAPAEVADVLDAVNGVSGDRAGILPRLTDLLAEAANWARARVDDADPDYNPSRIAWEQLANAHHYLRNVEVLLGRVQDHLDDCTGAVVDPAHRYGVAFRTRELPHVAAGPGRSDAEAKRQQAARSSSPGAAGRAAHPGAEPGAPPARPPATAAPAVHGR